MATGRLQAEVIEQNGCFRIVKDDGHLWVEEMLHTHRGEVPKRWRITFKEPGTARRFIATRLRDGHNDLYHFHTRQAVGQ